MISYLDTVCELWIVRQTDEQAFLDSIYFTGIQYFVWVCDRFINGGQLVNGLAGPVFMAAPPLISATWFPASQRTTATSLGILSGNVGFALAFIIGLCLCLSVHIVYAPVSVRMMFSLFSVHMF